MAEDPQAFEHPPAGEPSEGWLEQSGLVHIFRTFGMALQPAKLGLALLAILATLVFVRILDLAWTTRSGIDAGAIQSYITAVDLGQAYEEPAGEEGIFAVLWAHESEAARGLEVVRMGRGFCWLAHTHPCYLVMFFLGSLAIWSLAGGAICRLAAVQFALGEQPTFMQSLRYAGERFPSLFLAPLIPLGLILFAMFCLMVGGMILRIPLLGDLLAGGLFGLALLAGAVITILLLGLLVSGSLFWPAIATEGVDAYDTLGLSVPYALLSKPWKAAFYAAAAALYGGVCWVFVQFFVFVMLAVTHAVVSFGTSPFGFWARGTEDDPQSKLDVVWPFGGAGSMYAWPGDGVSGLDYLSAAPIGLWVLLVIGLMWSFLASMYFSASTVIYFLLRRDVDGTELDEIHMGEDEELDFGVPAPDGADSAAPTASSSGPDDAAAPGSEASDTWPEMPGPSESKGSDAPPPADSDSKDSPS